MNIGWSLGNYCNARCKHCYSWRVRKGKGALSRDEIDAIIDKLIEAKVETVNLGGNEPIYTHGPDLGKSALPHIIRKLTAAGIPVGITTNGTSAIELEKLDKEAFMMVNDWDVSLDSPFKEEHDKNRDMAAYDLATRALDLCTQHHKLKAIIACGMSWNLDRKHLDGFLEVARAYDAEFRINTLKPTENQHMRLVPSPQLYYEAFNYLLTKTDPVVIGESTMNALTDAASEGCPCGISSLRINSKTPEGTVPISPCVYIHDFRTGDLLSQSLDEIMNSESFEKMRCRNKELPSACTEEECDLLERCRGGCAARAYLIRGSLDERDPYCPLEAKEAGIALPVIDGLKAQHEGLRVHENYLCTWIGKPKAA